MQNNRYFLCRNEILRLPEYRGIHNVVENGKTFYITETRLTETIWIYL